MARDAGTIRGAGAVLREAAREARRERELEAREAGTDFGIRRVRWAEFLESFTWRQGEHVTLIGTTGSGKTTLSLEIIRRREHVAAFGTKKEDSTLAQLLRRGYKRIENWSDRKNDWTKIVVWPDISKLSPREIRTVQRGVFAEAIAYIYKEGGWAAFVDELSYIADSLKLDEDMKVLYQQGRSAHISILAGTQRPRFIPLVAYDQATHLFLWRENDEANIRRLAEINYRDKEQVMRIVPNLEHTPEKGGEFLYVNTRTGESMISKVELR